MSAPPTAGDFYNATLAVWPTLKYYQINLRPAAGNSRRWQPGDHPTVGVVELDEFADPHVSYVELAALAKLLETDLLDVEGSIDGGYYPGEASAVVRVVVRWRHG